MISLDYKLNFQPDKADQIPQLHARVADRMYNLFTSNGGLYIKIGTQLTGALPRFCDARNICQAKPSVLIHPFYHPQFRTNLPAYLMMHHRYLILLFYPSSDPNLVVLLRALVAFLIYLNKMPLRAPALHKSTGPSLKLANGWQSKFRSQMCPNRSNGILEHFVR